jgi:glycosyltransferase involved in cell wall biosynthesis
MLAPQPFFEPRGTPFSEYHRIRALVELGHRVDLVTYPIGAGVDLPNLRIVRSARLPFVRKVAIGPSAAKLGLDLLLAAKVLRVARKGRYDAIHSHEEAGILGVWLSRRLGIPHLYDMHSSLPQQLANFRYTRSKLLRSAFEAMERRTVFGSRVVITICAELQETVKELGAGERAILIENVMGGDVEPVPGPGRSGVRQAWGIAPDAPVALYTGTFEPYQGLDLLRDAAARLAATHPQARVVVVGGEPEQVVAAREAASRAGARMVFVGQRPPHEIPHFIEASDVLVSPRITGTNTPLKIYSYLRSGRPIVATDLLTHTQVLGPDTALLVPPEAGPFAEAVGRLFADPALAGRLAERAAAVARERYSRDAYVARTREAYERLMAPEPGAGTRVRPAATTGGGAPGTP